MNMLLSPQQLAQLHTLIPSLVQWLRSREPQKAADLLVVNADMSDVQRTLKELLNAQNFNYNLTGVQLRYICSCHPNDVWAAAVRLLITESDPRLVPIDVAQKLLSLAAETRGAPTGDAAAMVIGPTLDMLPRANYVGLGQLCGLVRDTASDPKQLAILIGPMLLAPRNQLNNSAVTNAASALMELLVMEAEAVFGHPGARLMKDACGVRRPMPNLIKSKPGGSGSSSAGNSGIAPPPGMLGLPGNSASPEEQAAALAAARDSNRRQQLKAFYQWKDPILAEHVNKLFDNHSFPSIAEAIMAKYGALPPGWKTDLLDLRKSGVPNLQWFDPDAGAPGNKSFRGRAASVVRGFRMTPKSSSDAVPSKNDKIINEILETETSYFNTLGELLEQYVKVIRKISSGEKGKQAELALGLSQAQVEQIFGTRLEEIVSLSHRFLGHLEAVSLIRTEVKDPTGRQGLVAAAFKAIAPQIHVYAPYVSAHKWSFGTLEKAINELKNGKKSNLGFARGKKDAGEMNFMNLWDVVSAGTPRLAGQTLQAVLIQPIQRIPRYRLLLAELIKGTPPEHPAHGVLTTALEDVKVAAADVNEALRQHEKLGKFFGEDEMIAPSFSAAGDGKIRNGYVDGL